MGRWDQRTRKLILATKSPKSWRMEKMGEDFIHKWTVLIFKIDLSNFYCKLLRFPRWFFGSVHFSCPFLVWHTWAWHVLCKLDPCSKTFQRDHCDIASLQRRHPSQLTAPWIWKKVVWDEMVYTLTCDVIGSDGEPCDLKINAIQKGSGNSAYLEHKFNSRFDGRKHCNACEMLVTEKLDY